MGEMEPVPWRAGSLKNPRDDGMLELLLGAAIIILGTVGPAMAQDRIRISSDWGEVTADLADNKAAKSLARMLPLTIERATIFARKRPAICRPHCRSWGGNVTSRPACSASGVPIILLSTIAAVTSRCRASSCSEKSRAMSRYLTALVPSPSESSAQTDRRSMRGMARRGASQ